MKSKLILFFVCASVGYCAGFFTSAHEGRFELLSQDAAATNEGITYEKLPCPSEAEFQEMAAQVKLEVPEGASLDQECGTSQRAVLAKALRLMKTLKLNLPKDWPEPLRGNLSNAFEFLKSHVTKMALDLKQVNSVAYNIFSKKEIYVGGYFFKYEPLDGVSVLVHEARHSDSPPEMGHTLCEAGDIPKADGGCDPEFAMGENAGAYSYEVFFNVALAYYSEGLSEVDREIAATEALVTLGSRFNKWPEAIARKVDVLAVLTENNELKIVHPFSNETRTIPLPFPDSQEKALRIEFAPEHNGVLIYTNQQRVWTWAPIRKFKRFLAKSLPENLPVLDIVRTRVSFKSDSFPYVLRTTGNDIQYLEYSPQEDKNVLLPFMRPGALSGSGLPERIHRHFLALNDESIFLTEDGHLHFARHYGNEPPFHKKDIFKSAHGWMAGTGGILYDTLYLLDVRGDLKRAEMEYVVVDEGYDKVFQLKDSILKVRGPLKKFAQGLKVQMGLDSEGVLQVWSYENTEPQAVEIKDKVIDFVIMQRPELAENLAVTTKADKNFQRVCGIAKPERDPWFEVGMGYDAQGNFVVPGADPTNPCMRLPGVDFKKAVPYYRN